MTRRLTCRSSADILKLAEDPVNGQHLGTPQGPPPLQYIHKVQVGEEPGDLSQIIPADRHRIWSNWSSWNENKNLGYETSSGRTSATKRLLWK